MKVIEAANHSSRGESCQLQIGETEPFISELLTGLTSIIQDLETHQIHMFYEAVGLMTGAEPDPQKREEFLVCSTQPARPHQAAART